MLGDTDEVASPAKPGVALLQGKTEAAPLQPALCLAAALAVRARATARAAIPADAAQRANATRD